MDRLRTGSARGFENRRHVEVALQCLRGTYADCFVRQRHVERLRVRLGVDRDGFDAEALQSAEDPARDFAAIGDQDLVEHQLSQTSNLTGVGL
jgi:hypothetical protein